MIHKFPTGTKEQNDLLVLPQGALSIDGVNSIRVHNGEQSGGGILELERVVPPPPPGFHGEVSTGDLISGDVLASLVGLSAGVSQNSNEPWLHFVDSIDSKTKFIAKKPFRHTVTWSNLDVLGIVYGKEITIQGKQYICRLIKGANSDPNNDTRNTPDPPGTWGSEWNRLLYPICAPTGNPEWDVINDTSSLGFGAWANYAQDTDLGLIYKTAPGYDGADGAFSWCQEKNSSDSRFRVIRGSYGVSMYSAWTYTAISTGYGWRPLLELVE